MCTCIQSVETSGYRMHVHVHGNSGTGVLVGQSSTTCKVENKTALGGI